MGYGPGAAPAIVGGLWKSTTSDVTFVTFTTGRGLSSKEVSLCTHLDH